MHMSATRHEMLFSRRDFRSSAALANVAAAKPGFEQILCRFPDRLVIVDDRDQWHFRHPNLPYEWLTKQTNPRELCEAIAPR